MSKVKFIPLEDRLLVKRADPEDKTPGGIIIPENAKDKPNEATVVAAGPGRMTETGARAEPHVKKGDRVMFGKYNGTEIEIEGEEYVVLREGDILGIIETE